MSRIVPAVHLLGEDPDDTSETIALIVSSIANDLLESARRADIRPDSEYRITVALERVEKREATATD